MTPNFTAHYCELTWFRPWFHLVPQVGKGPEISVHTFGVKVRLAQKTLEKFLWFSSWHKSLPFLSQAKKSKGATYSSLIQTGASSTSDLLAWLQRGERKNFTL